MKLRPVAALLASLLAAAVLAVAVIPRFADTADTDPAPRSELAYLRAAHWFGGGWAVNFWNTDLESRAAADFARIVRDGFNAVVIVVPWSGFAPGPTGAELDPERVERLRSLMRVADSKGLDVVLRVSYAWDALAEHAVPRLLGLWTEPTLHGAWLKHLEQLWQAVGDEPNLLFGFFSWEDLWAVVNLADADSATRLAAAATTGFRHWLQREHTLDEVSAAYDRQFGDWSEVPLPQRREPAFELMLRFMDEAWIERYFRPAQQRFPKLSMEVRIDADPVYDGDRLLRWHSHESAWDLPGAAWTTIYWSPSMGGENRGETLTPAQAADRLETTLRRIRDSTGARQIFIGQFLAEDFTPGYEANGRIPRDAVDAFLRAAERPLANLAGGYGLWTWTDYGHDAIGNPEFLAGSRSWSLSADARVRSGMLELPAGAWVEKAISVHDYHSPGGPKQADVCIEGHATANTGGATVTLGNPGTGETLGNLTFGPEPARHCLALPVLPMMNIRATTDANVRIERINSIGFVQPAGIRDLAGKRKPIATAYRELNEALQLAPRLERPRHADGWMGRSMIERVRSASGAIEPRLRLRTHLPDGWPLQPTLDVRVMGEPIASIPCVPNGDHRLALPTAALQQVASGLEVQIDSSHTYRGPGDARALGCLVVDLTLDSGSATARPD